MKYLSLLVVLALVGCNGPNDPVSEPTCDQIYDECVSVCPVNCAPGDTRHDSCEASCRAEHGLCVAPPPPPPPALECQTIDWSGYCDNFGCQQDSKCNRDPNGEFGPEVNCTLKDGTQDVWTCKWSSVPAGTK